MFQLTTAKSAKNVLKYGCLKKLFQKRAPLSVDHFQSSQFGGFAVAPAKK